MDFITFYGELSSLISCIPEHNVQIIGGDTNAQIGEDENNTVYTTRQTEMAGGGHLTEFSLGNRLTCLNTKFRKKRKNYGPTPTQIMVKQRLHINLKNGFIAL